MASIAETILNSAMGALVGVSGESVIFRNNTISALVDRTQTWSQPSPATFVEVLASSVSHAPAPGEQFKGYYNATFWPFTVLFVKPISGWYRCECYCLKDTPTEEVTIGAELFDCYAFTSTEGTDLELGGLTNQNVCRLVIDRADINGGPIPTEGQAVTFRGSSTYRVARVQRDHPSAPIIVDIADEAGGRR